MLSKYTSDKCQEKEKKKKKQLKNGLSIHQSQVIREMQIKMRYHYTPMRMTQIQNTNNTKYCEDVEQELSFIAGGHTKLYSPPASLLI